MAEALLQEGQGSAAGVALHTMSAGNAALCSRPEAARSGGAPVGVNGAFLGGVIAPSGSCPALCILPTLCRSPQFRTEGP